MSLFITGTDTGVGKTHIAARVLHLLRASGARCAGMKPICCGDRRDAERLLPIVGSLMEKVSIDVEKILASFQTSKSALNTSSWKGQGVGLCRFAQTILLAILLPR